MANSDFSKQVEQWKSLAKGGDAGAALSLGNHYHDLGDFKAAFSWYSEAAKQKRVSPIAFFYLGYAYQYGEGTAIDRMQALSMYQRAAEFDVPQALYSLAYFYQNGIVVPRDESMAQGYMKQATRKMDTLYMARFESQEEVANLRAQVAAAAALQPRNEALATSNGKLSKELEQANAKYQRKLREWEQQTQALEHQQAQMVAQNQDLNHQLQEMTKKQEALQREIDAKSSSIQEKTQEIDKLQQHLSSLRLKQTQMDDALEDAQYDATKFARAFFRLLHWNDVHQQREYATHSVSIFGKYTFSIDGVTCCSMESFLQSLKFKDSKKQLAVCSMTSQQARACGRRKNRWRWNKKLWWKGIMYKISSSEYQSLLDRAFDNLYKNSAFANALRNCKDLAFLTDTAPSPIPLTEDEYVSRLLKLRNISEEET